MYKLHYESILLIFYRRHDTHIFAILGHSFSISARFVREKRRLFAIKKKKVIERLITYYFQYEIFPFEIVQTNLFFAYFLDIHDIHILERYSTIASPSLLSITIRNIPPKMYKLL